MQWRFVCCCLVAAITLSWNAQRECVQADKTNWLFKQTDGRQICNAMHQHRLTKLITRRIGYLCKVHWTQMSKAHTRRGLYCPRFWGQVVWKIFIHIYLMRLVRKTHFVQHYELHENGLIQGKKQLLKIVLWIDGVNFCTIVPISRSGKNFSIDVPHGYGE